MRLASTALCAALCMAAGAAQAVDSSVALAPQINAADFAQFDKTLSSDEFGGRKPGTAAEPRTINWLVEQYKRMGLQPGNHGSWFQTVPANSIQLLNTDVTLNVSAGGKTSQFANHDDMLVQTLQAKAHVDLKNSPIVFLGFGADAPQWHWNDYKDIDVKGKTVIVLVR
jgi:hypothetical protein